MIRHIIYWMFRPFISDTVKMLLLKLGISQAAVSQAERKNK